jgi:CRP/FNR family transcriptional regulator/CRP/FNR family cyclic AMP-dependent transcriptional regulator
LRKRSEKVERLKRVDLFAGLSNKDLNQIAQSVDEVSIQQGHVIARQGGTGREMFIILEGRARVERDGRLIARLKANDTFGEMSLIDGEPRSATVKADSDVTLLVVESRAFLSLLDAVPGLARRVLRTMSARLRTADIQLASRN